MNHNKRNKLPALIAALGAAAALIRSAMYLWAVDDSGLLPRGHWLFWLLLLLCGAAAAAAAAAALPKGSNRYCDNFHPGIPAAAGSLIMAAGVVLTLLGGNPMSRTILVRIWYLSGIASAAGLVWAGLDRFRGRQPYVLCHSFPVLFLALHMVSRYQAWSGNPQVPDWLFSLLGAVGLTLFAYGNSAFDADCGRRRSFLITGLLTGFACLAATVHTDCLWLYICGSIWAFTGLCRVEAIPEPEESPESRTETE